MIQVQSYHQYCHPLLSSVLLTLCDHWDNHACIDSMGSKHVCIASIGKVHDCIDRITMLKGTLLQSMLCCVTVCYCVVLLPPRPGRHAKPGQFGILYYMVARRKKAAMVPSVYAVVLCHCMLCLLLSRTTAQTLSPSLLSRTCLRRLNAGGC